MPEVDPSMLVEDSEDELQSQPCPVCGEDDNEDVLLLCDGCDAAYHTYCIGLEEVPRSHWFCDTCDTQRACPPRQGHHHIPGLRTRAQQSRRRHRAQVNSSGWARVWQSVWDRLNFDLDFPFDEPSSSRAINREHQRDFRQWQRRFEVAQSQGAASRFRDTATTLLERRNSRPQPELPSPESQEEIRAWNAFEKAKDIQLDPTSNRRKRKSATASPSDADPAPQPERRLKRPRTRRTLDAIDPSTNPLTEASSSRSRSLAATSAPSEAPRESGPSFFQSLLKDVETSKTPVETTAPSRPSLPSAVDHSSPQGSSPGSSPTSSGNASPRARSATPPPHSTTRAVSPTSLTSHVEPIFPEPEFSPERSPAEITLAHRHNAITRGLNRSRRPRALHNTSPGSSPPRSNDTSPSRGAMSLSAKTDLQKMVGAALKPYYRTNAVSKDQYTNINRNISRLLYEKAGDDENVNGDARPVWERLANEEVTKAVQALQTST